MDLCNIQEVKALLARHGFHFSKSMGQNFLIEPRVPQEIAAAADLTAQSGVLEIGPGIGPLTVQLARQAGKVVSVELDRSLLPILEETLSDYPNVTVLPADILKIDLHALAAEYFPGLTPTVCANLPYNITTPVLTTLLDSGLFHSLTVMIQREVAQRICATPGNPDYGAFSIYCQYHANCSLLFEVPPTCFLPAPKVTSAVLQMLPYSAPPVSVADESLFFRTVKASFAMRRKTLLNGLAAGFPLTKGQLIQVFASCGLPDNIRGERLSIEEFARLSDALGNALEKGI